MCSGSGKRSRNVYGARRRRGSRRRGRGGGEGRLSQESRIFFYATTNILPSQRLIKFRDTQRFRGSPCCLPRGARKRHLNNLRSYRSRRRLPFASYPRRVPIRSHGASGHSTLRILLQRRSAVILPHRRNRYRAQRIREARPAGR